MVNKLKTLKDIEDAYLDCTPTFLTIGMREEAMKWVKATEEQIEKYGNPEVNTTSWCGKNSMKTQKCWIMQFFNITEKELNDAKRGN